jgi:omega-6 fatty acid desaturase (delta-12 desaturase)
VLIQVNLIPAGSIEICRIKGLHSMEQSKNSIYEQLPAIVRRYQLPDYGKATIQVLNSFLPFIAIWITMYMVRGVSLWLTFLLAIVNALFLVRIFIIQHDCGHESFTASRKVNTIIGTVASFLTFIPYKYWTKNHNYHHGHNGILDNHRDIGDINTLTVSEFRASSRFQKIKYMIFRSTPVLFLIGPLVYIFYNNRFPLIRLKGWEIANRSLIWSDLFLVAFYAMLVYFLGWEAFFLVQLPILACFGVIALWFFYIQHQHKTTYKARKKNWDYYRSAIQGSSYYKLPRIFQWFSGNIGFHHIHHLNSLVPNYELARCHHENPVFDQIANTLTFSQSLKCIFNKLWDEDSEQMVTWKEYFKMEKKASVPAGS